MNEQAPPPIRRVVTGHDGENAVVLIDAPVSNRRQALPTVLSTLVWSSDRSPADIAAGTEIEDMGARVLAIQPPPNGSRFAVIDIAPGASPMHATDSLDYAVVISGEIDCDLPSGTIKLRAGDVLVQRGTEHAWMNRSAGWARVATVLIDAVPPRSA
jgi:quercetin dioxygenase-like cupin family protein